MDTVVHRRRSVQRVRRVLAAATRRRVRWFSWICQWIHRHTRRRADRVLADGRVPMSIADLDADEQPIAGKQFGITLAPGDVVRMRSGGGGGFGDPLSRDPRLVAEDVRSGVVSPRTAEAGYGVVLDTDGHADASGTDHRRRLIRRSRSGWHRGEFTLAGKSRPALVSTAPLSSRLSDIGMWSSPRENVQLIEYADPDTLELLWVEVRAEKGDISD